MKNTFSCHSIFWFVVNGSCKCALMATLIFMAISASSCRTIHDVQILYDSIDVHDTTTIYKVDTVRISEIIYENTESHIENKVYTDTEGVIHNDLVERTEHYVSNTESIYISKFEEILSKIKYIEEKIDSSQYNEEVQKPKEWYENKFIVILIICGVCFLVGVLEFIFLKFKSR